MSAHENMSVSHVSKRGADKRFASSLSAGPRRRAATCYTDAAYRLMSEVQGGIARGVSLQ